ncbi:MAG: hypothetical protein Q6373_017895 [Candidatus Sigynarchaeota archaeon]
MLIKKAKQSSTTVTDFLRKCIFDSAKTSKFADHLPPKDIIDDMIFMFKFFQKNAKHLDITDEEREQFNKILKKVKEMTANEP